MGLVEEQAVRHCPLLRDYQRQGAVLYSSRIKQKFMEIREAICLILLYLHTSTYILHGHLLLLRRKWYLGPIP
ncbi:hypothetical protein K503DRAFT_327697 [Rhizopogon vinicolor AM-OR11-026]|uniref:Uncharacterized protein n=1 Tax=Rhizopogon vinicolor AM-OR11-026 TaxID=1314800 RepID=A0A1B7MU52_9AGAM|nr:hypothetical protein K503DRAFT_327697 [Rhizopogon vinicolor AM-OR11-026]